MSDMSKVSDGYHTFEELYEHRHALFIALLGSHPEYGWCSKTHSDGSPCPEGWFIAGINIPSCVSRPRKYRQISYHLPLRLWDTVKGLGVGVQPPFDGHTSADVVDRLYGWVRGEW